MIKEIVRLEIGGSPRPELIADLAEVEVEEHVSSADVFRVRLSLSAQQDGTWKHLDDPGLAPWNRLAVIGGYPGDHDTLIDGYITHASVFLSSSGLEDSYLELTGMDATARMDLEDKQLAWPNKKDSQIAQEIFTSHGLSWEVEDTVAQPAERLSTVLQSESDIQFLRRLARRNGFECFVRGSRGYFRSPNLQDPPQKLLALRFGAETDLELVRLELDATPATSLEIRRIDPMEKTEQREALNQLPRRALGKRSLADLRGSALPSQRLLKQQPSSSSQEMRGRLRASYEPAAEFVRLSGEIDGRTYGAVLRAKRLVTVKGLGASHSGLYYVTRVRHLFSPEAYTQSFEAYRNGLDRLGVEDFAAPRSPVPLSAGASTQGNRTLPAQQGSGFSGVGP
ncbi:MAG TPA: contractile injection system protein, VgrG/Pvc8 family [Polyangiaceae bacterium]|nr:contractile injection system protein, VgrG/Pvc8 family [Polyangiaceae bacterium]